MPTDVISDEQISFEEEAKFRDICATLSDTAAPIEKRMRSLFKARDLEAHKGVQALSLVLNDSSALLAHEAAYLIGQFGLNSVNTQLISILQDPQIDCIVRHEAGEALAAIGDSEAIELLSSFLDHPEPPLRETCYIALRSLREKIESDLDMTIMQHKFRTIDPIAAEDQELHNLSLERLGKLLLDPAQDLYYRYKVLFELRNRSHKSAHRYIANALIEDASSALFRHEVAFVLGQVLLAESLNVLKQCLFNEDEHPMVRHEAALAIASVAAAHPFLIQHAADILSSFTQHKCSLVRESCLVALDNLEEIDSLGQ